MSLKIITLLNQSIKKTSSSFRIITAMVIGLIVGATTSTVFFGVDEVANAFVMLLQMTAIPYISLSLIIGLGSLSAIDTRSTFKKALLFLVALLATVLFFIFLAPIAFPNWQSADFYSLNTIKTVSEFDIIALFIPTNPFYALANGLIPSIVLFSIFIGLGLMQVKAKKYTLLALTGLNNAVINVSHMAMRLAPLGIFCIALRAAATVDSSQLDGLLVYIVTAAALVILLTFIILPACVATITPLTYRQILTTSREAMITAFATGSFFIVIPIIVEKTKVLIKQLSMHDSSITVLEESSEVTPEVTPEKSADATSDNTAEITSKNNSIHYALKQNVNSLPNIIVPICYSLPIGGKLLALLFTLFAAWFSGSQVTANNYFSLLIAGLPQLFGSNTIAMPNLLALFNVPTSMFEIFLVAENLIVGRLGALLSVIFSISLVLLTATSMLNKFTFKWRSFSRYLVIFPVISIIVFLSLRFTFDSITHQYQGYTKFIDRDFILLNVEAKILDEPQTNEIEPQHNMSVLNRIKQRGFIRVGFFRDDLPYAFHNKEGKLVGFDIEIINLLADDLGVSIEFVRIFRHEAKSLLSSGYLDMTTGVPVLPTSIKEFTLTIPYSSQSIAFIVKEERRNEFTNWSNIFNRDDLIIGIPEIYFSENLVNRYFHHGKVWEISTPRLFFRDKYKHIDAMLFGAATASAWTLLHPEYSVVAPSPAQPPLSMAFAINEHDEKFELFMRNWIEMKKKSNSIDQLFTYWIAGKKPNFVVPK
ncbi:MAG: cation:dicarboxylase symporter family transporter [Colwellia sp.]